MYQFKEPSSKLILIGVVPLILASYLVYKAIRAAIKKQPTRDHQLRFSKYIRDNFKDNQDEFYTHEHLERIKNQILNLSFEKMTSCSNLSQNSFQEDNFIYINTEKDLANLINTILNTSENAIGVDIEQTNLDSYQGYNCLIQIATSKGNFLIDAILLHDVIPFHLKQVFENENIIKIFYSGTSDLQWINRDHGLFIVNYFDVHQAALFLGDKDDSSLVGLFQKYCSYSFDKTKKKLFQTSDWRKRPLTKEQCNYAALDVHYLIHLRKVLLQKVIDRKGIQMTKKFLTKLQENCFKSYQLKPFTAKSYLEYFNQNHPKSAQRSENITTKFLQFCRFVDQRARELDLNCEQVCSKENSCHLIMHFMAQDVIISEESILSFLQQQSYEDYQHISLANISQIKSILSTTDTHLGEDILLNNNQQIQNQNKSERKKKFEEIAKTAKPYDNCQILGPDGQHLSTTNKTKVQWYLKKNLATLVQEDPLIIKLNFLPSEKKPEVLEFTKNPEGDTLDFLRKNQCVVCGQEEGLTKYHLVPSNYRQHFPVNMKEHRALDIILLCLRCLDKANKESHKYQKEIAEKYNVPLAEYTNTKKAYTQFYEIQKLINKYLKNKDFIPLDKQEKFLSNIRKNFEKFLDQVKIEIEGFEYDREGLTTERIFSFFQTYKNPESILQSDNKDTKNIHGKLIVEKLATTQNIQDFIHQWRLHFIRSLDPQFLPKDLQLILSQYNQ